MRAGLASRDPVLVGLLLGYAADRLVGDPRRCHPVAGFGQVAARVEATGYAPTRARGALCTSLLVGAAVAVGLVTRRLPSWAQLPIVTGSTWLVLGGQSLAREGHAIESLLGQEDLEGARRRIRHLVGRDPSLMDSDGIARACVESLAENSADAVVAPLVWGAFAGVPGLLGHRAVNTLDAMWGHRSERYRDFGWAAARLDDAANWAPARLTVALSALLAGPRRARHVLRIVRRDAPRHPSPNAGPVEAAWAAALELRLGGVNTYHGQEQDRGHLGDGHPVTVADIPATVRQLRRVCLAALGTVALGRLAAATLRRRASR